MSLNFVQQIFFKLFALIMSVVYSFNGGVAAPSTDDIIKAKNDDAKLVFATVADPQVSNYMFGRYQSFQEACIDLRNAEKLDAIVGVGDIAENGLAEEYQLVYDELKDIAPRYIMAEGNHDIRLRAYSQSYKRFSTFTNALNGDTYMTDNAYAEGKFAYSETVNGYKFIVMGSDKMEFEESYISSEQLAWIDAEIASVKNGDPVFVVLHQPLKLTHNLPTTWGNGTNKEAGSVGDQNDEIKAVLNKYAADKTVILITGHLHAGFSKYSYEKIDNFHSINVPALSIENKDGEEGGNGSGLTYIVEVYDDEVLFRARNCRTGEWLTKWDTSIPLK
ncbi:MAG: metallophosphoesterase [Clostridia bacterium]|nr:metallophosphoesterase [Clostridia bacterium]